MHFDDDNIDDDDDDDDDKDDEHDPMSNDPKAQAIWIDANRLGRSEHVFVDDDEDTEEDDDDEATVKEIR